MQPFVRFIIPILALFRSKHIAAEVVHRYQKHIVNICDRVRFQTLTDLSKIWGGDGVYTLDYHIN